MLKNSDLFYNRAAEYQGKRKDIVDAYEKRIASLEKAKGSQLYTEETEKAEKEKDAALSALQAEYNGYFEISLNAMREANGKRGVTPPTEDQLRIIQALKMRESVSQKELDRAANSCNDNALCISIINEIAKKNGYVRGYHSTTGEMSAEDADAAINSLAAGLRDFVEYDTPRAARLVREHNTQLYGADPNAQPLPKRKLFESKSEFYDTLAPFGMNGDTLSAFCAAVDAE